MDHFPGKANEPNTRQQVTETPFSSRVFRGSVCEADPFPMKFKSLPGQPQALNYFRAWDSSLWR